MSDSGEALVDGEARIQERIEEREQERKRRQGGTLIKDPEQRRMIESLRLARAELERQSGATGHPIRRQQIALALAEIDKRLGRDK